MKRFAWIALVVLAIFLVWFFLFKKKKGAKGTAFPTARPFGASARPLSPLKRIFPGRAMKGTGSPRPGTMAPLGSARPSGAIPTIRPEVIPPFTLGPVPNGITRVPEPPTGQPYAASDSDDSSGMDTLYDQPAGANSGSIAGLSVPSVQNPWETASWKFLIGAPVGAAQAIISNLFPSFPFSVRSTSDPPLMSGALVVKHDGSNKVVAVVRD